MTILPKPNGNLTIYSRRFEECEYANEWFVAMAAHRLIPVPSGHFHHDWFIPSHYFWESFRGERILHSTHYVVSCSCRRAHRTDCEEAFENLRVEVGGLEMAVFSLAHSYGVRQHCLRRYLEYGLG